MVRLSRRELGVLLGSGIVGWLLAAPAGRDQPTVFGGGEHSRATDILHIKNTYTIEADQREVYDAVRWDQGAVLRLEEGAILGFNEL